VSEELLSFPGSVFYNPEFLRIAAEMLELQPCPLVFIKENRVAALANFMLNIKYGINTMTIPKLFQYYGPARLEPDSRVINTMEKYLEHKVDLAIFSLTPEFTSKKEFDFWKKGDRLTYYLKPETFENLRKNCFEDVKNKLNKAIKSKIAVKLIGEFPYNIYMETFRRRNLNPPLVESRLALWVNKLIEIGLAKTYAAYQADKLVAFRTQLIAHGYAYDWLAGSLPEAQPYGVNQFLMLSIGQELFEANIINWDLLGGDIKSIGDFKRSFGSEMRPHLQVERAFTLKGKIYRALMKLKGIGND